MEQVTIPYEDGTFECTINDLIKNHNLVLCNQRGDALFYFDEHEGKPIFLASPIESRHRTAIKNWQKTIRWSDYSYETGFEQDYIVPRSRVKRACRILGLKLQRPILTEKQIAHNQRQAEHLRTIRQHSKRVVEFSNHANSNDAN